MKKAFRKNGSTVLGVFLMLTPLYHQREISKISRLTITEVGQDLLRTELRNITEPVEGEPLDRLVNIAEKEFQGALEASWNNSILTLEIFYRPLEDPSLENTQVLTINLPFSLNKTYQKRSISYSPSAKSSLFKLNSSSIQWHSVDQKLYLLKQKKVNIYSSALTLKTKIFVQVTRSKKQESYHPKIEHLEVQYKTNETHFNLKLLKENIEEPSTLTKYTKLFSLILLLIFILKFFINPALLYGYFDYLMDAVFLIGIRSFMHITPFLLFYIIKFFKDVRILFHAEVIAFICFGFNLLMFYEHARNVAKEVPSLKHSKFYLRITLIVYGVWFAAVFYDFRVIFRSMAFSSVLVGIDLWMSPDFATLRLKPLWQLYVMIMMPVVDYQIVLYAFYGFIVLDTYLISPFPLILAKYILPDLLILLLMMLVFSIKFGKNKKAVESESKKREEDLESSLEKNQKKSDKIAPVCPSGLENLDLNIKEEEEDNNFTQPIQGEFTLHFSIKMDLYQVNHGNPILSKASLIVGQIKNRIVLRYVSSRKKFWDIVVHSFQVDNYSYYHLCDVWMNNQKLKKVLGCYDTMSQDKIEVRLVHLRTRKFLRHQRIKHPKKSLEIFLEMKLVFMDKTLHPVFTCKEYTGIIKTISSFSVNRNQFVHAKSISRYFERVESLPERMPRSAEYSYFDDLVAIKYMWVDRVDLKREFIHEEKYQLVLISQIDLETETVRDVGCIDEGSFRMIATQKLDTFFFNTREILAMVLRGVIYLVDWKASEVKRAFKIEDLYSPLLRKGIRHDKIYTDFYYDRRRGRLQFIVGTLKKVKKHYAEVESRFVTDKKCINLKPTYHYAGWVEDSILYEKKSGDHKECNYKELKTDDESNSEKEEQKESGSSEREKKFDVDFGVKE